MKNLINIAVILVVLAVVTALGDAVGGSLYGRGAWLGIFLNSLSGMAVLGAMSLAAYALVLIPGFNKLPVIFWVSLIAAFFCSPLFPYHVEIYKLTSYISLTVISTVVLAFAGLSLGKDIDQFKAISWKIVPVSLAVFTGTFVFAALIAQVTLHWSGTI